MLHHICALLHQSIMAAVKTMLSGADTGGGFPLGTTSNELVSSATNTLVIPSQTGT